LIEISNDVVKSLNASMSYSVIAPIYSAFSLLSYISMFVSNIIYSVLIVLAIIAFILINSLMVFNIEEKTYEFGMLRALGF
jgi:ABC-type antimicrobial peptide transport system permease subunit